MTVCASDPVIDYSPTHQLPHLLTTYCAGACGRTGAVLRKVLGGWRRRPEKHAAGWRCPRRCPRRCPWRCPERCPRGTTCGARDVDRQPALKPMGRPHLRYLRYARRCGRRPQPAPQPQPALEPKLEHGQPPRGRGDGAGAGTGGAGATHPSGRQPPPCLNADASAHEGPLSSVYVSKVFLIRMACIRSLCRALL